MDRNDVKCPTCDGPTGFTCHQEITTFFCFNGKTVSRRIKNGELVSDRSLPCNQDSFTTEESFPWLASLYSFVEEGSTDRAVDLVLEAMDNISYLKDCDNILRNVNLTKLDTYLIVAFLSAISHARNHLKEYIPFVERARIRLQEIAPDRVDQLLTGFRNEP